MLRRRGTFILTLWLAFMGLADAVLAQRAPPSAPTDRSLSFSGAWEWFAERPGVLIALGIIVVMFIYVFLTRKGGEAADTEGARRD
jgi:hypothetical protein